MKTFITSKLFSINWRDVLQALVVAVITPVVFTAQQAVGNNKFPTWEEIGMAAVGGFIAYLAKNFFTPAKKVEVIEKTGLK